MTQQYVVEIHTKKGDVYYYVTDVLDYIAGVATWFMDESPTAGNYIGVYTNLDILLGLPSSQATVVVLRGDLSHLVYRNVRVQRNEDGTHTAFPR